MTAASRPPDDTPPQEKSFYYVVEHDTGIVRAAVATFADAERYTTPENCHLRFIVGPITRAALQLFLPNQMWSKTATRQFNRASQRWDDHD